MFFIGVFGIENKSKEIKELRNLTCKKCKDSVTGQLIKNYSYFHLFFVPIFKWDENYYVKCNQCGALFLISKEKGKAIESGKNIEVNYWDLQESYDGYYHEYNDSICRKCGSKVESQFKYCPYCGEKV